MMARRPETGHRTGATPAITVALEAEIEHRVHTYEHDPAVGNYSQEAAEAMAVPPERVFKTLLADSGSGLVVGIVPVTAILDLKALARAVAAKRVTLAEADVAERATGYVVGGISPLGQRASYPTVLDMSAARFSTIFVSAGRRGMEIELSATDLMVLTNAGLADIGRDG